MTITFAYAVQAENLSRKIQIWYIRQDVRLSGRNLDCGTAGNNQVMSAAVCDNQLNSSCLKDVCCRNCGTARLMTCSTTQVHIYCLYCIRADRNTPLNQFDAL